MPIAEVLCLMQAHVKELHDFYGLSKGIRIARKHVSWYLKEHAPDDQFRRTFNTIEYASEQLEVLEAYFEKFCVNQRKELTELCSNNAEILTY